MSCLYLAKLLTLDPEAVHKIIEENEEIPPSDLHEEYKERMDVPKTDRMVRNYLSKMDRSIPPFTRDISANRLFRRKTPSGRLNMIPIGQRHMGELDDKSALVTGASKGIGRGIAAGFAREGAAVAVNYHSDEEAAEETVRTIEDDGGTAVAVQADVSDENDAERLVETVTDQFGGIDVLVNNAGVLKPSPLAEMDVETWDQTISVDLRGTFLVTRFAIEAMLAQSSGRIINIASQLGIKGAEDLTHYSAAKGGVIAFTRALAREVAPDVQVNAIAPGPIETDLLDDTTNEWRENKKSEVPLGRIGTVDEVVPTAILLAGDGGDYYTGQTLSPDGGDAMH